MNQIQMANINILASWQCIFEYVKYPVVRFYEDECEDFYHSAMRLPVINDGYFL